MKTPSCPHPLAPAKVRRAVGATVLGLLAATVLPAQALGPAAQDASPSSLTEMARAQTQMAAEIRASRAVHRTQDGLPAQPSDIFKGVDLSRLLVVVETGIPHLTVLDGDRLQPIQRLPTRPGLQGEPQFTPDGRHVFVLTRDGWLSKFDLWHLALVAEIRVGVETRNMALSGDGRFLAVANAAPHSLVLLNADLEVLKVHAVRNKDRSRSSRILAVHDAPSRQSFVAALQDVPEIWEISYDPRADDVPIGVIHDFLYKEGAFIPGFLNPRRSYLPQPVKDFVMLPGHDELLATSRDPESSQVVHLDVRKPIATPQLAGSPNLGAGVGWIARTPDKGRDGPRMAVPDASAHQVTVLDAERWQPIGAIATRGAVTFMGSHDHSPYLWVATRSATDCLQVVDKRSLDVAATLPIPCSPAPVHVGFSRDGRHALVSLPAGRHEGGALVILDAVQLTEMARLPMEGAVGAYRVGPAGTGTAPGRR